MTKNKIKSLLDLPGNFPDIACSELKNNLDIILNDLRSIKITAKDNLSDSIFRRAIAHKQRLGRLLSIYQFEHGLSKGDFREITLLKVIQPIIQNFEGASQNKNVKIEIKLENPLVQITVNEKVLSEVITLIIRLLIHRHNAGRLQFESLEEDNSKILRMVMDSGKTTKISPSDKERDIKLFFKRFQFELAFVKQLLDLLNSTFHFISISPDLTECTITFSHETEAFSDETDDNRTFRKRIEESKDLPTLSNIASEVVNLAKRDDTTANDLAKLISKDPALSAKLLKVVNTSYYSFSRKISTLSEAIAILGLETVRNISLSISIIDTFPVDAERKFDFKQFWKRSIGSAVAAEFFAKTTKSGLNEEAFLAGLLQDVGSLILSKYFPETYLKMFENNVSQPAVLLQSEKENWGIDHAEIGKILLENWNLPDIFKKVVEYHHNPDALTDAKGEVLNFIKMINLSNLASLIFFDKDKTENIRLLKHLAEKYFEMSGEEIDRFMEKAGKKIKDALATFNMSTIEKLNYSEVLHEANLELGERVLSYEQLTKELQNANEKLNVLNKKLENQAVKDGLTGIYNHRYLFDYLIKEFANYIRHKQSLSCILMDIDYFKLFNDNFGHKQGDMVLQGVAKILEECVREGDIVARYGGEEFVAVLPKTDKKSALVVAERLRSTIEGYEFPGKVAKGQVTVSIGVATADKNEIYDTAQELVDAADGAMYNAKKNGRNRVEKT